LFATTVFSKPPQELLRSLWVSKKKSVLAAQGYPLPSGVERASNQNRLELETFVLLQHD